MSGEIEVTSQQEWRRFSDLCGATVVAGRSLYFIPTPRFMMFQFDVGRLVWERMRPESVERAMSDLVLTNIQLRAELEELKESHQPVAEDVPQPLSDVELSKVRHTHGGSHPQNTVRRLLATVDHVREGNKALHDRVVGLERMLRVLEKKVE